MLRAMTPVPRGGSVLLAVARASIWVLALASAAGSARGYFYADGEAFRVSGGSRSGDEDAWGAEAAGKERPGAAAVGSAASALPFPLPPSPGRTRGNVPAVLPGDFTIGALFSVHHQPNQKQAPKGGRAVAAGGAGGRLQCGEVRELYGIQRVEATFMALEDINSDPNLLPNITLGVEIRDSCWYAPIALQQSIEFIRDAIAVQDSDTAAAAAAKASLPTAVPPTSDSEGKSKRWWKFRNRGSTDEKKDPHKIKGNEVATTACPKSTRSQRKPLIGVVGPGSSSVALQVQNLLQLFHIPQVGYSTTSRDLSDKSRFEYFLRVVPSDYFQAQLLVDIVKSFNWTYVSTINTDENYGQSGMQAFRELAEQAGVICVAREASILSHAEDSAFDGVLRNLAEDPAANVVVCFCEGFTVRGLLAASRRLKLTNRFLFIGSDGWADRGDVVEGLESEAVGSLSIRIHSPYVKRFDDLYFRLNPFTNDRNPWFREFWEERFNCTMPPVGPGTERARRSSDYESNATSEAAEDSSLLSEEVASPLVGNATLAGLTQARGAPVAAPRKAICTGQERLSDKYRQDPKLSFVIKAIYALAHGLHGLQQDVCGRGSRGLCPQLFPFNGSLFKSYLMNVTFEYWEGDLSESVEFDRRGDPPGRYNIMNFQQLPNGSYDYIHVGDWINGSLNLWETVKFEPRLPPVVNSVCSKPCQPGYFKNFQSGGQEQRCCWVCVPCDKHEILVDEVTCEDCPLGYWPDANKTRCEQIPVERVRWSDPAAAVALSFSAAGFISAAFSAAVFLRHNDTPVVKASTRELSYLIAGGAVIGHAAAIPLLATPSPLSCALARTLPGLSLAVIYAALLTKTNRIARIMAAASATYVSGSGSGGKHIRFPTRKPRLMSAAAQVAITSALIGVEAGVAGAMLALEPPDAALFFPAPGRARLACNTSALGVVVPLTFGFTLLALCTAYAVKTRNVPENFREAKFIGFATYTTAVIWVAFVPIYFGSDSKVITMCLCVTLSASVTMGFIFVPKLYVILWRPERNDRAYFTTATSIRCHVGGSRPAQKAPVADSHGARNAQHSRAIAPTHSSNSASKKESPPRGDTRRCTPYSTLQKCSAGSDCFAAVNRGRVEQRTLSCQTSEELLEQLLEEMKGRHRRRSRGDIPFVTQQQGPEEREDNDGNEHEGDVEDGGESPGCGSEAGRGANGGLQRGKRRRKKRGDRPPGDRQWSELSPKALLLVMQDSTPHIVEESASDGDGGGSGKLKQITISLGGPVSPLAGTSWKQDSSL